jgi:hypothetical protein
VNSDRATLLKYWERTGCLLTADGTRDDRVHLHSTVELGKLPDVSAAVDVEDEQDQDSTPSSGLGLGEGKEQKYESEAARLPNHDDDKKKVKREDIDNLKHDDDEFDLDDDADEDDELPEIPLRDALPADWSVVDSPPTALDAKLVNSSIMLRWRVFGWATGKIVRFYNRKPKHTEFNYEVKYVFGSELRDHMLQLKDYHTSDSAPHGSWCIISKQTHSSSSSLSSSSSSPLSTPE